MRKKGALSKIGICILFLSLLSGCGGVERAAAEEVSSNVKVNGPDECTFIMPDAFTNLTKAKSFDQMEDPSKGYEYTKKDVLVIAKDTGLFAMTAVDEKDSGISDDDIQKFSNAFEKAAGVRVDGLSLVSESHDRYRSLDRTIYKASMEGLYSETFFLDYTGYITTIVKNGTAYLFAAGSPSSDDDAALYQYAKSFEFREYDTDINAKPKSQTYTQLTNDSGGMNSYVKCAVYYRGRESGVVTFGLSLTNIRTVDDPSPYNTGSIIFPKAKQGYTYVAADFSVDSQGYDVSTWVPDIRIRLQGEDGRPDNSTPVCVTDKTDHSVSVLALVKQTGKPVKFAVGRNAAVITSDLTV